MGWSKDLAAKTRALANDLDKPRTPGTQPAAVSGANADERRRLGEQSGTLPGAKGFFDQLFFAARSTIDKKSVVDLANRSIRVTIKAWAVPLSSLLSASRSTGLPVIDLPLRPSSSSTSTLVKPANSAALRKVFS
jgi:hypothetical protein